LLQLDALLADCLISKADRQRRQVYPGPLREAY